MAIYSRRNFLKQIGAAAALILSDRTAFSLPKIIEDDKDFEMLIVGDSLIAGQGLKEKDKFYTLTKNWLQNEFFGEKRKVNLKNKSHSGARLFLQENEIKAMKDADKSLEKSYHQEVNFSFPSIKTQIDIAKKEYASIGKSPEDINLVMLTGGITNLNVSYIINPFNKNKILREKIDQYCNQAMFEFLQHATKTFPNALFTVIGYFPMVSKQSSTRKIYNAVLELYKFPLAVKPLMNNILTRQFFRILHKKINKRSRIWAKDSDKALQTAVRRINQQYGTQKAIFIKSPVTEATAFGTKNTLLWGMAKKGRSEDDLYDARKRECKKAMTSLKDVKLKFNRRFCELSGIGHPNIEGSKAYRNAISKSLMENSKLLISNKIKN